MARYRTISVNVDVDVDLQDIDTDDLKEELESRGVDVGVADGVTFTADRTQLQRIRGWIYAGKYEPACREMGDLIRDALGTAI